MEQVTVVATIRAKPGKEEDVKKALLKLIEPTRAEAGCINYDLHQAVDDRSVFVFHENWTSRRDLDEHLAKPHLEEFMTVAENLLDEPVDIRVLTRIA